MDMAYLWQVCLRPWVFRRIPQFFCLTRRFSCGKYERNENGQKKSKKSPPK